MFRLLVKVKVIFEPKFQASERMHAAGLDPRLEIAACQWPNGPVCRVWQVHARVFFFLIYKK